MINENSTGNLKCVMVIDNRLPAGLIANTAAILGKALYTGALDLKTALKEVE